MVWRMIYIEMNDENILFEDTIIKWNHMNIIYKILFDKFKSIINENGKTNLFVMGSNTFRNLPFKLYHMCFVFTRENINNALGANSLKKNINFIEEIPKNNTTDVWFLGGFSIFDKFYTYMDEIIRIKYNFNLDKYSNSKHNKKSFVGRLSELFSIKNDKMKEYHFDETLQQNVFYRIYIYEKIKKKEDDHDPILSDFYYDSNHSINYSLAKVFKIQCAKGFPVFGRNLNYINYVFEETWKFLNGSLDAFDFCNSSKIIMNMNPNPDIDPCTMHTMNVDNIYMHFLRILDFIIGDVNFHLNLKNSYNLTYRPIQIYGLCKNLDINLFFKMNADTGMVDQTMIIHILEMNLVYDYPFIITAYSLIMFILTHYLNQNRMFVYEIFPREIILMVGKCFYPIKEQNCICDYTQYPIIIHDIHKPIQNYCFNDINIIL
jgi:hypothetical protein